MRIVLLGGGGHASDVLGAIEAVNAQAADMHQEIQIAGILADDEINPERFHHRDIEQIGSLDDLPTVDASHYIACAGYPEARKLIVEKAKNFGKTAANIIHPKAWVPPGTRIGEGTVVLAGVCISPCVTLGKHVYLSHGCLIGHDCRVHDFVSVMPGGSVSGDTILAEGCIVGANATVLQKIKIGRWTSLGAGAVAVRDIPEGVTAVGIPARVI